MARNENTVIVVNQQPDQQIAGSGWMLIFFGVLVVGLVMKYWLWFLAATALIVAGVWLVGRFREENARINELIARADEQHNWVLSGDERGVYGSE